MSLPRDVVNPLLHRTYTVQQNVLKSFQNSQKNRNILRFAFPCRRRIAVNCFIATGTLLGCPEIGQKDAQKALRVLRSTRTGVGKKSLYAVVPAVVADGVYPRKRLPTGEHDRTEPSCEGFGGWSNVDSRWNNRLIAMSFNMATNLSRNPVEC